jgi:hypothetical protein
MVHCNGFLSKMQITRFNSIAGRIKKQPDFGISRAVRAVSGKILLPDPCRPGGQVFCALGRETAGLYLRRKKKAVLIFYCGY